MKTKSISRLDSAISKIASYNKVKTAKFVDLEAFYRDPEDDYPDYLDSEEKERLFHGDYANVPWQARDDYASIGKDYRGKPYDIFQFDEDEALNSGYIFGKDDGPYIRNRSGKHYDILDETNLNNYDQDEDPANEEEFYGLINEDN